MNKYRIKVVSTTKHATGTFTKSAESAEQVILEWILKHPDTTIVECEQICTCNETTKPSNGMTPRRWRNHHKARITQMRNNAQALMSDEDAFLTDAERLQLSRIACQFDRILSLWTARTIELQNEELI